MSEFQSFSLSALKMIFRRLVPRGKGNKCLQNFSFVATLSVPIVGKAFFKAAGFVYILSVPSIVHSIDIISLNIEFKLQN